MAECCEIPVLEPNLDNSHVKAGVSGQLLPHVSRWLRGRFVCVLQHLQRGNSERESRLAFKTFIHIQVIQICSLILMESLLKNLHLSGRYCCPGSLVPVTLTVISSWILLLFKRFVIQNLLTKVNREPKIFGRPLALALS